MIRFEEAYKITTENVTISETENVNITNSLHRILAENVVSDMDMPPFDKSAVDGYACKYSDIRNNLEILEIIQAGEPPTKKINKNQCSKIMTGAKVPEGADCVLMIEHCEKKSENIISFKKENTGINISKKAEDIGKGDIVLKKGILIKPQHIALMSSVGVTNPLVYKKPRVAVISTGNELVEPHIKPSEVQIRNSNAWQLISQIHRINAEPVYFGIVKDNEKETENILQKAMAENNVVIFTGGVSMGDFDYVPKILKQNNVRLLFEKIMIKPGKPTVFGVHEKGYVFGLPGNPVSSFILFEILVKPFLYKMMGMTESELTLKLPFGVNYMRKKTDRLAWIPCRINSNGELIPVDYHGSAHLFSVCEADFIIPLNIGVSEIKKGEFVDARQI